MTSCHGRGTISLVVNRRRGLAGNRAAAPLETEPLMQNSSLLGTFSKTFAAQTALSVLQDLAAHLDSKCFRGTLALGEGKVSAVRQRVEQADASFSGVMDRAVWDWERAVRSFVR